VLLDWVNIPKSILSLLWWLLLLFLFYEFAPRVPVKADSAATAASTASLNVVGRDMFTNTLRRCDKPLTNLNNAKLSV
jgi:uncharacterized BrkB/YihY/UPF0761 family membrane protein